MAGVKAYIGSDEHPEALEKAGLDPERRTPKKTVVNEKKVGARFLGSANGLGASVHGESDFFKGIGGSPHLYPIERIVDVLESVDLQEGPAPRVEFTNIHGSEYKIKEPFGEGGTPRKAHDSVAAIKKTRCRFAAGIVPFSQLETYLEAYISVK
jgi:hypothetical protein